jgi:50S ribosomal subunit-associated GTPase HflX
VFNKMDRINDTECESLKQRIRSLEPTPAVFVSAHQPETLEALRETLRIRIRNRLTRVVIRIPVIDGQAIAAVYREGEVLDRVDEQLDVCLTARLPEGVLGRLTARAGIEIEEVA